jgi:hypothetical protein
MQTPMSATSSASKFNLNVRAMEFKPTAPVFNPGGSNAPSSPSSTAKAGSISRAASPSVFFGSRKPLPPSQRPSISANFQTIKKLRTDLAESVGKSKKQKPTEGLAVRDYAATGGIPPAYLTQPRWPVLTENEEKTYHNVFDRPPTTSPGVSRTGSAQAVPYQQPISSMTAQSSGPVMTGHHPMQPGFAPGFDEQRMPMMQPQGTQAFASPNFQSRQPSAYASPMGHPAQLSFGQQPYYGGQMQMPMRQYPGPGPAHAAVPMMMHQQSNGPYGNMPQQFGAQVGMYSPSSAHVYPQQNGYGSPGRAPSMMQQGSQQGHGQAMMWSGSAQGGPMYGQQGQNMYRGYQPQYGSSPQQSYLGQQQRTMSNGYGQMQQQKMMHPQHTGMGQDEGK